MLLLHTARALKILYVLCVNKKYRTKNAISYYCLYRVFTVYYNPIYQYICTHCTVCNTVYRTYTRIQYNIV